jgi:uncharacterized SAM-binding protein YcdF (DUF218 family)
MSRFRTRQAWLLPALAVCLGGLATGFLLFADAASRQPVHVDKPADAVVVLTGGSARLGEAGRLMREGYGRRLLISGVNLKVHRDDLERLTGLDDVTFRCCVDVGYAAQDTIGNAGETRSWAQAHGIRRLIVVTAAYHMPRSLAELAHAMPNVELAAHPVLPREQTRSSWWTDAGRLRVLASEYLKLLSASARLAVARLFGVDGGAELVDKGATSKMAHRQ